MEFLKLFDIAPVAVACLLIVIALLFRLIERRESHIVDINKSIKETAQSLERLSTLIEILLRGRVA